MNSLGNQVLCAFGLLSQMAKPCGCIPVEGTSSLTLPPCPASHLQAGGVMDWC